MRARPAHAAQGTAQPGRRREVVVNGKRVKTVDVHAHSIVPAAAALINHPLEAPGLLWSNVSDRIAAMDAQGIDVEALSINPYWYRAERDAAAELIKIQNETLVEFCAANPDRFVAFATVGVAASRSRREQVEYAVKTLGFRGCRVGGSVAGEELADPKFHPFWAKCEELGVLVFLHPLGTRELEPSGRLGGSGLLTNTIGNPLETTIALSHLIFEGTLDRFPGLEDLCRAWRRLSAVLRQPLGCGHHDLPEPRRPVAEERSRPHICETVSSISTRSCSRRGAAPSDRRNRRRPDHDRHRLPVPVDHGTGGPLLSTPGLSDDDKIAILGGTAAKLKPLDLYRGGSGFLFCTGPEKMILQMMRSAVTALLKSATTTFPTGS